MNRLYRGLAFVTLAGSLVISSTALAQRGNPSGGSGGRGGSGGGGGGRSESSSRSDSAPRRDSSPPPRVESSPRRDDSSSRRDTAPSRREDTSSSRRDAAPPRRDDSSPRRDSGVTRRDDTTSRTDSTYRRGEYGTRRDDTTPRRDSTNRRDTGDDWLPRRDSSTSRDRAPIDSGRTGRDPVVGRGHNPDIDGPHDIFTRTNPGRTPTRTIERTTTTPQGRTAPDVTRRTYDKYDNRRGRDIDPTPRRDRARELFVRTNEGRRYNNGIILRDRYYTPPASISFYFGGGGCYYPYYAPAFNPIDSYWSPFSFYYGCTPRYIYRRHTYYYPPPAIYIEVPIYSGADCRGYDSDLNDYYLSRDRYDARDLREIGLESAIDDIREAFRFGEVEALVGHTDPSVRIAVFRKGKYEYSMEPSDYLDATRDAMRTMETIQVDLYRVNRRAEGVYVISGKHVYSNREGERRTMYVSFVMERLNDRWILTQVGTAPDRIEEPR